MSLSESPKTIADGAAARHTGDVSFEVLKKLGMQSEDVVLVSDQELITEMKFVGERLKMLVEPAGVLGLAGLRKFAREKRLKPPSS